MSQPVTSLEAPCDLRFGQVGLACLRVRVADAAAVCEDVERRVQAAPQMFARTAVIVDLSHLPEFPDDGHVDALLEAVRSAGMLPVGLAYADERTEALAQRMGLAVVSKFRAAFESTETPPARAAKPTRARPAPAPVSVPAPSPAAGGVALHHDQAVRSGQQIYARDRDLVIAAGVGNGAEVIADGSIHIYGTLRGRALAGAQGDEQARIFCTDFQPELVSIAGHYRVFEEIPREFAGQAVQCWLQGEKLLIDKL